jgi:phosphatidylglycerophosphatase C
MSIDAFQELCNRFVKEALPGLIRPQALETIRQLQKENVSVVVVTASADNWVKGWCNQYHITCLGSCLEVREGQLTGKLNGANCHSEEKVRRIKEHFQLSHFSTIYCYGDTKGDKPMLQLATHAFYKPFRSRINA